MNQTIQLGQVRPSVLSNAGRTVKNCKAKLSNSLVTWLSAKNEPFTAIAGEKVTNKHVFLAHLYILAMVVAIIVASWLEGGAL